MYLEKLSQYALSTETLLKLLKVYEYIGKKSYYESTLDSRLKFLEKESLLDDCKLVLQMYKTNVSADRIRLILTKDSEPRTKEEERIANIKKYFCMLYENSIDKKLSINSADLLDYLKVFTGLDVKFSKESFKIQQEDNSVRYFLNKCMDDATEAFEKGNHEKMIISIVTVMEVMNLKPFTCANDLASFILLTYYFGLCGIILGRYYKILSYLFNNQAIINNLVLDASVNYDQGILFINKSYNYLIDEITKGYLKLEKELSDQLVLQHALKTDFVEKYIMEEAESIFSKEDIAKHFPGVSATTIVRVLTSLRDKKFIIPLGTGRSAKWQRIVDSTDPRYFLGVDIQDEN